MQVGISDIFDSIDELWNNITSATGLASEYNNTGAAINQFMVDLCNKDLLNYGIKMSNNLVGPARALGAIFAICVAASRAYKVMAEGDRFNVLSVMRPLIFAFVLSIWPAICTTLLAPGQAVEGYMRDQYVIMARKMDNLREKRKDLAYKVNDIVLTHKTNAEKVKDDDTGLGTAIWEGIKEIGNYLLNFTATLQIWISNMLENLIQAVGEMVFAVCVYIVFLLKSLYLTVLMMFGPIYIICSILDVWKNTWTQWVGHMVAVSMFGAMAYLVMTFSCALIAFTIQADIDKLYEITRNPSQGIWTYMKAGFGTTVMSIVGYLAGAIAMSSVSELASLTFPSQSLMGASSFMQGMKGFATKYTGTKSVFRA